MQSSTVVPLPPNRRGSAEINVSVSDSDVADHAVSRSRSPSPTRLPQTGRDGSGVAVEGAAEPSISSRPSAAAAFAMPAGAPPQPASDRSAVQVRPLQALTPAAQFDASPAG
ncbi:MAG: hypothetical protein ACRYF5_04605, partial [Janthinobacterium lividum]